MRVYYDRDGIHSNRHVDADAYNRRIAISHKMSYSYIYILVYLYIHSGYRSRASNNYE